MAKPKPRAKKPAPPRAAAPAASKAPEMALGAAERDLLARLASRTRLSAGEVLSRALASYAAAVAPELVKPAPAHEGKSVGRAPVAKAAPPRRLFYSVDGAAEREAKGEVIFGRDPGSDVHLDLPLIGDRHARLTFAAGRWLFEDLRSPRGSYKGGQLLQVAFLEDGDEIDLGGFLPVRFRLA